MSAMGSKIIRDADAASLDNAAEVSELRAACAELREACERLHGENRRLRDVIARARALLDEGDPAGVLEQFGRDVYEGRFPGPRRTLDAIARTIREALALLAEAT